ncbi:MAG: murein biosynthesis integral membrane protein MurJ [Chloroflexi bacterium]|nr:murein biosynthesis integral membrane protein MurJ [Chloroflexota bacterium]
MTAFTDRRLLLSSAIIAAGFFSSKVLGLVREIVIARTFGTSGDLDALFAATTFSDLLFSVIAGGAIASIFIPVFSGYLVADDAARQKGWQFASAVVNDIFLVVAIFSFLGAVFAAPITDNFLAPGFPPERRTLTADLLRLVLISTTIFGVSGMVTSILHAHNHFVLPALAPSLYNIGIIAGALWLAPRWGIFGLAYGIVIGSALHLTVQIPGLLRYGARYFPTLGLRQTGLHHLLHLLGPRVITMLVVRLTWIAMTNFASRLGEGSISAITYAYSIWQFPESLIGTAIALAAFPRLSAHAAQSKSIELRTTYRSALFLILLLAIPATIALMLFPRPIVSLLLQRGAFSSASTELVATVLQFFALSVIGESVLELTARIFYAQRDARTPMVVAIISMIARILLMIAWSETLGVAGLALAYSIGVLIEGGTLAWLAHRRENSLSLTQN